MTKRLWPLTGPAGTTVTAGSVVAADGTVAASASAGAGGTMEYATFLGQSCIRLVGGGTATQNLRLPLVAAAARAASGLYHGATALPPTARVLGTHRHSSGYLLRYGIAATGALILQNAAGVTIATSNETGAWAPNRWNRLDIVSDNTGGAGAGTATLRCYNSDGTTATGTVTASAADFGTALTATTDLGTPADAGSTWEHFIRSAQQDDGATTGPGPYTAPAAVTTRLTVVNGDGTAVGAWGRFGDAATDGAAMSDNQDGTGIISPVYGSTEATETFPFQPLSADAPLEFTVRSSVAALGGTTKVRLLEGSTVRQEWDLTQSTTPTSQLFTVSNPAAITDRTKLQVQLAVRN